MVPVDWYKFCVHLRSLSVRHSGMVDTTGLKYIISTPLDYMQFNLKKQTKFECIIYL
jgi:hypothetical protein